MKIKEILNLASTATTAINPLIGGAIALINSFIPSDSKKIEENSTVAQINNFIDELPTSLKSNLLEQEVQLDNNYTERYTALTKTKGQQTRAKIAMLMTINLFIITNVFTIFIAYSFFVDYNSLNRISELWTVFLTLCGVPASVIQSYFGNSRKEKSLLMGIEPKTLIDRLKIK